MNEELQHKHNDRFECSPNRNQSQIISLLRLNIEKTTSTGLKFNFKMS